MLRDLRFAFRSLARTPAFTFIATGLLALGIGLSTVAFGVVNGFLLQPPPYDHPERIVVLSAANQPHAITDAALSYPTVADVRAASRSFEAVSVVRLQRALVTDGPPTGRSTGARVGPDFFRVFGVSPIAGRSLLPSDEVPNAGRSIVLSERAWQNWFASQPSVVGRTLALDGILYTVVGVMPAWFDYPIGADFWIPFDPGSAVADRTSHYVSAVARLAPRTSLKKAQAELSGIADRLAQAYPASDAGWQLHAMPLHEFLMGDIRSRVTLAGLAALVVLLIACANVASLLLARNAARQNETAVRRALGASNGRIIRQVVLESLVIAFAGACIGTVSAQAVAGALRRGLPGPIPAWVSFSVDLKTVGFVAAAAVLSIIVAGIVPALSSVRAPASSLLGARASVSMHQRRTRRGIVVVQIALATVLLTGAGLLSESLLRVRVVQPGFDPKGVVTAHVTLVGPRYTEPAARERFYEDVLARLRTLPNVQAVGATDGLPLTRGANRFAFTLDGEPRPPKGSEPIARDAMITPGYLSALRIPVLRGRDIEPQDDARHPRVALVSASWARQFVKGHDPIGQRFRSTDGTLETTIVGVVGDVRHDGLETAGEPTVYMSYAQNPVAEMSLAVRGGCDTPDRNACDDGSPLAPEVRRVVTEVDPSVSAYALETMSNLVNRSLSGRRAGATLAVALALVALLLASAGIYGLMVLHLALGHRDVGIRLALGAQPRDVRRRLLGEGLRLAAIGATVGLAISALAGRAMASVLYGVTQSHLATLLMAGSIMVCVGVLASWGPAARAAAISPAGALQSE